MKKLWALILAALLTFSASAHAVELAWDANPPEQNVQGYILYWHQTADPTNVYNRNVGNVTNHDFGDQIFQPDVEYTFWATAYNDVAESGPSETVTWTRQGFTPPADNEPTTLYVGPGATVNIQIKP